MKLTYQKTIGAKGEKIARKYLKNKGYIIIEKNFRVREGEIDIIAKQENEIIFIEVKTRTSLTFGLPEEAVGNKKQEKYALLIEKYIKKRGLKKIKWHLEIISVFIDKKNKQIRIKHFKKI